MPRIWQRRPHNPWRDTTIWCMVSPPPPSALQPLPSMLRCSKRKVARRYGYPAQMAVPFWEIDYFSRPGRLAFSPPLSSFLFRSLSLILFFLLFFLAFFSDAKSPWQRAYGRIGEIGPQVQVLNAQRDGSTERS